MGGNSNNVVVIIYHKIALCINYTNYSKTCKKNPSLLAHCNSLTPLGSK